MRRVDGPSRLSHLKDFICRSCFTRHWWIVLTKPMRLRVLVRNWLDRLERAFNLLRLKGVVGPWIVYVLADDSYVS